jgi:predicted membrane channel-forming protein YqfA (hemolysin III family)
MFVAMGMSALVPVIHGVQLYGVKQMQESVGLTWLILQGFLYMLGAGLYAVGYLFFGVFAEAVLIVLDSMAGMCFTRYLRYLG